MLICQVLWIHLMLGELVSAKVLGVDNYDSVLELYEDSFARANFGFLSEKSHDDLFQVLSGGFSVGAFFKDRLVGYSLSLISSEVAGIEIPAELDGRLTVYIGQGSVVSNEFEGRMIMSKMLRCRLEIMGERGDFCSVGLVNVDNYASIVNLMRAGFKLGGVRRDAQSLNYIAFFNNVDCMSFEGTDLEYRAADYRCLAPEFEKGLVGVKVRKYCDIREVGMLGASNTDALCKRIEWRI